MHMYTTARFLFLIMMSSATSVCRSYKVVPRLVVFDLDMCMWSPEMYELSVIPDASSVIKGKLNEEGRRDALLSHRVA